MSVANSDQDDDQVTSSNAPTSPSYFPRRLVLADAPLDYTTFDEAAILALSGSSVVLSEPGMGKSELMRELGRRVGVEPVTAIRFVNAKRPARFVAPGAPVLIDGLDEALSRREGDAVDAVLAQLEEAGAPPFVLSCRSREWQARATTSLRQLYGRDPSILTLEPLAQSEALSFLEARYPTLSAEDVLDHLAAHGLQELYRNPLTLGLLGRVAMTDTRLPDTRAVLFERVCTLIWPEHDSDRQDEGLGRLTEDDAFDGAGAIAAALLFAGAEAASLAGVAHVPQGDLGMADLERLPRAGAARAIFSSKLFRSVGSSRAMPIHRVVAEYVAARWLARQADTPRVQRRLLAHLHGRGGVPASLRGLHAWLAHHAPAMAERIVACDPYGVLRYGEAAALSPHLAGRIFQALQDLAEDDPWFRSGDGDRRTAAGLMIPALQSEIEAVISSKASGAHLRSLLIEGLEGSSLAAGLATSLEAIVLSADRYFSERQDAADALLPHRDRSWWGRTIAGLAQEPGEDCPRLARHLIPVAGVEVSDELLVSTIFGEMGLTNCPLPRRRGRRVHTLRLFDQILDFVPTPRLVGVLNLLVEYSCLLPQSDWENGNDLAEIVARLFGRAMVENAVIAADAGCMWRWLGVVQEAHAYSREERQKLAASLSQRDDLRHAIQDHVMVNGRGDDSLWVVALRLQRRMVGLRTRPGDLARALDALRIATISEPATREDWMDLVRLGWGPDGLDAEVAEAAERVRNEDRPLADFLAKLARRKKPAWEVRQDRRNAKRARKRAVRFEFARRDYDAAREALRAGELGWVLRPAQAYLGLFGDLSGELQPPERLAEWLGPALRDDALAGFEAVLHRSDLPTAAEIADGFAEGTIYNISFAIMAGLHERIRTGRGIGDLSGPLKLSGLLLNLDDHGWNLTDDEEALRLALEAEVIPNQEVRRRFARLRLEPQLKAGKEHVGGLYQLAHEAEWQATGAALAAEWLMTYADAPAPVELGLIDCLTHGGALDALREVAVARARSGYRDVGQRMTWLAVDALVRFDDVAEELDHFASEHPEFIWVLRDRLQLERRGAMLPLTTSQIEWIVSSFRGSWAYARLEGSSSGSTNDHDATDFLRSLVSRLADDVGTEAGAAMARLASSTRDTYTDMVRHMAVEQRQKKVEEQSLSLSPAGLGALLGDGPPEDVDDLKALVVEELGIAASRLGGDELDVVRDFWDDDGIPRDENRCRDRLAAMIGPELARYDVQRMTEADMPWTKRADLAFSRGAMQIPMEVKGQWHPDVWDAAQDQLADSYLTDWRSQGRGIYCVFWFGDVPSATGRRLKIPPDGLRAPADADEMRAMLISRLPAHRRMRVDIVVINLSNGRR